MNGCLGRHLHPACISGWFEAIQAGVAMAGSRIFYHLRSGQEISAIAEPEGDVVNAEVAFDEVPARAEA
jgi:hypothetical protein